MCSRDGEDHAAPDTSRYVSAIKVQNRNILKESISIIIAVISTIIAIISLTRGGPRSRDSLLKDFQVLDKLPGDSPYRKRIEVHIQKTIKRLYFPIEIHSKIDFIIGLLFFWVGCYFAMEMMISKLKYFSLIPICGFLFGYYLMQISIDEQKKENRIKFWNSIRHKFKT